MHRPLLSVRQGEGEVYENGPHFLDSLRSAPTVQ
jgi:hypothetical protein